MEIEVEIVSYEEVVIDIVSIGCSINGDCIGKVNFKLDECLVKKCWNDWWENGLKNNWLKIYVICF